MNRHILADVVRTYEGSDGDATKALYDRLTRLGLAGIVATNVFRALKNSTRAKRYRGGIRGKGSFRSMAYERKNWAINNLSTVLGEHASRLGIVWGWGADPVERRHTVVLYIDLPTGQVSFHTEHRGLGPDYPGRWDGVRGQSVDRVCRWVAQVLSDMQVAA